jgi:hypothetical protein
MGLGQRASELTLHRSGYQGTIEAEDRDGRPGENVMSKRKNGPIRILRVRGDETLKELYAKARRSFTAADLQRYTVTEKGVRGEQVLAELQAIHREELRKLRKSKKKKGVKNGRSTRRQRPL